MAIDLKKGIDLKDLGAKVKALFSKDSNIFEDKLVVFFMASTLLTLFLIYSIYAISDNQSIYDEAKSTHNNASVKLNRLETKFKKTLDVNKVYFKQLLTSPKTDEELSEKITTLISQYNLLLKSIDLNTTVGKEKAGGVKLAVSGSYLNLIRFSSDINEILAASKVATLSIKKPIKGSSLIMEMSIIFSVPPSANILPLPPTNTVSLINKRNVLDDFFNLFISSANASEEMLPRIVPVEQLTNLPPLEEKVKIKGLSLFQKAHKEARSNGLIKFEFTNRLGETKLYLTGLKEAEAIVVANQKMIAVELPEIVPVEQLTNLSPLEEKVKIKGLSLFQKAHKEARSNGLIKFEFTNRLGETKLYLTGLKEAEAIVVANQKMIAVELPEIVPVEQLTNLSPLESPSLKPVKKIVVTQPQKAKPLNKFQKAYVDALAQGQRFFEYPDKKGNAKVYKTDEEGFKLAGFVQNPTDNNQKSENQAPSEPESLRDPFSSPGQVGAPKVNKSSSGEGSENSYYLSGIMTSESLELCVIITPLGESKIYHVGEKLKDKIMITGISDNAILINNSTKNIMIGDEIK